MAWTNSDTLPRKALRRDRGTHDAMAGALSSADSGLLLDVLTARLLADKSFVSGFRLRTTRWRAIIESETRRCLRSPQLGTRMLALGLVLVLAHFVGGFEGLFVVSLGVMVFAGLSTSSLRLYARSPGLARSLPHSVAVIRLLLALPTTAVVFALIVASSVVALSLPASGTLSGFAVGTATVAGLAGGIRWATVSPTQFSAGIVMTEMGPVHASALLNAIRGIDFALLLLVPLFLGLDPLPSLVIAVLVWLWTLLRD